jgi:hypothetical protein
MIAAIYARKSTDQKSWGGQHGIPLSADTSPVWWVK